MLQLHLILHWQKGGERCVQASLSSLCFLVFCDFCNVLCLNPLENEMLRLKGHSIHKCENTMFQCENDGFSQHDPQLFL